MNEWEDENNIKLLIDFKISDKIRNCNFDVDLDLQKCEILDNKLAEIFAKRGIYTEPNIDELAVDDKVEVMSKSSWHLCTVIKIIEDTHIVVRRCKDDKEFKVPLRKTRIFKGFDLDII